MDDQLKDLIAGDDDEEEETRGLGALSGILGALMGGAAPAATPPQGSGSGLGDLLGMLGGAGAQPEQSAPQQGSGLGDLLGMLGGGQAQQPQSAPQGGGLSDLLGMLGGSGTQQQQPTQSAVQQGGGLMGGLLGSLLGGGTQSSGAANPLTGGIAKVLAEKLGVSPAVANTIVGFALTLLMQSLQKRAVQRSAPGEGVALSPEALEAPELGEVLKTLGGRTEGARSLAMRGAPQLAAQAGIDQETAERGLAEAFLLLSGQQGG